MTDIIFEQAGNSDDADSAVLDQWLVADGDAVTEGQHIAVVAVAKTSIDIEAPVSGRITILLQAEETVSQGQVIARIEPA